MQNRADAPGKLSKNSLIFSCAFYLQCVPEGGIQTLLDSSIVTKKQLLSLTTILEEVPDPRVTAKVDHALADNRFAIEFGDRLPRLDWVT